MLPKGFTVCPNEWITDNSIKNEFRLLLYISKICEINGFCNLTNKELAEEFLECENSISRKISNLYYNGLIDVEYLKRGSQIVARRIFINN